MVFDRCSLLVVCLLLSFVLCALEEQQPLHEHAGRPNILFVLTDDQDVLMGSLNFMPHVREHLIDKGLHFKHHYCTVALCCPSRVSLWTGKAAHNTNVTDINPPYGGYPKFISQGFNDKYLPVWMQAADYNTYYTGKLFNAQTVSNYDSPHAAGWTGSDFLLDPFTYRYLNATFQRNHDPPMSYEGQYVTDVLAEKASGFLDDALVDLAENGTPFFLTVAPTAPHSDVNIQRTNIDGDFDENTNVQSPPIPAERHRGLFKDEIVPRTSNFNPDHASGVSWISRLPKQSQENVDWNDEWHRNRLRALQAVDEMLDSLVQQLDDAGVLDNTYIFYSSDNGYTIGQHRRQPGKQCAFEQDINVPLIVRGPGIPEAAETSIVTNHVDLAPTFLQIAGAPTPPGIDFDGQTIPFRFDEGETGEENYSSWRQEHVNVEMWGIIMSEGKYGMVLYPNHTYKALRIQSNDYSLLYTVWCWGEHELYDMTYDPTQVENMLRRDVANLTNHSIALPGDQWQSLWNNIEIERLVHRLDALLMVLKTCAGLQCTHPWEELFPNGEVKNLNDALSSEYDEFFETKIERVAFDKCERGYIAESEGPVWNGRQVYGMVHEMSFDP